MKKVVGLMVCLWIMMNQTFAIKSLSDTIRDKSENYWNFLRYPSEDSHTYLLTMNYGFMISPIGKTISNQGLVMNFGINLARFFSNKILLGVAGDLKISGGYLIKQGDAKFLNDLVTSSPRQFDNSLDSANASIVMNALTKSAENPITGSRCYNIGIMFSPFPDKFGGIMVQVRRGSKIYKIDAGSNPFVNGDNGYLEVSNNWIYEITFKPWTFKSEKFPSTKKFKTSITASVHYERVNFGSAKFNGTSINKMYSYDFIDKYQFDHRIGFKIGLGFY